METFLIELLSFILGYHTILLLVLMLFSPGHPKRLYWQWVIIPGCTLYLLLPWAYNKATGLYFWLWEGSQILGWYNFSYLIYWVVSMIVFYAGFRTTAKNVLFYGIAAYTVQNLCNNLRSIIRVVFFQSKNSPEALIAGLFTTSAVILLFYAVLVRRLKRGDPGSTVDNSYLIAFLLIVLFVVNVFSQYWGIKTMQGGYLQTDLNGMVFTVICTLLLLILQFGLFEESHLKREKIIMEQLIAEQEKQHRSMESSIEIINRKCHDLKHQISAMRLMDSKEDRDKNLAELERAVMLYDCTIKTGNRALDVLLTEKSLLCEKDQITFSCIADGSCISFIELVDIYALFGNALDNAIECVSAYQMPEYRQIALNIGRRGNIISIKIENHCDHPLRFEDGLPRSTKGSAEHHGFGTKSIRYVVEKYHGDLRMKQEHDIFSLDILFFAQE